MCDPSLSRRVTYLDRHVIGWDVDFQRPAIPINNPEASISIWIRNNLARVIVEEDVPSQSGEEARVIVPSDPAVIHSRVCLRIVVQHATFHLSFQRVRQCW